MIIKSKYHLRYQINKKNHDLIVEVELKQNDEYNSGKNIWQAHVKLNGEEIQYPNTEYCVNAYYLGEEIGLLEKKKLKDKYKKKMKIVKEIIK